MFELFAAPVYRRSMCIVADVRATLAPYISRVIARRLALLSGYSMEHGYYRPRCLTNWSKTVMYYNGLYISYTYNNEGITYRDRWGNMKYICYNKYIRDNIRCIILTVAEDKIEITYKRNIVNHVIYKDGFKRLQSANPPHPIKIIGFDIIRNNTKLTYYKNDYGDYSMITYNNNNNATISDISYNNRVLSIKYPNDIEIYMYNGRITLLKGADKRVEFHKNGRVKLTIIGDKYTLYRTDGRLLAESTYDSVNKRVSGIYRQYNPDGTICREYIKK